MARQARGCRLFFWPAIFFLVTGGSAYQSPPGEWQSLFDGESLRGWRETPFNRPGEVRVTGGAIVLGKGRPMTGVNWTGQFPKSNYEIRLEAARADGGDFFAAITFPVNDSYCTWVNGGWGGQIVGLSSIDGYDASENETSIAKDFEKDRWYRLWLVVTGDRIRAWIDDEPVIDIFIGNREVGLRPGETELSKPLGIASYSTTAKLRKLEYRLLEQTPGDPQRK